MKERFALTDIVSKFHDECSREVGKSKEEEFHIDIWNEFIDLKIESPIEQILYCALRTIQKISNIDSGTPTLVYNKAGIPEEIILGLEINPQTEIGKYRVDFEVYFGTYQGTKTVIVECDSQQFHERTEIERRYEKARDRYLHIQGYTTFHYTGKEILENPYRLACEIISFVIGSDKKDLYDWYLEFK